MLLPVLLILLNECMHKFLHIVYSTATVYMYMVHACMRTCNVYVYPFNLC